MGGLWAPKSQKIPSGRAPQNTIKKRTSHKSLFFDGNGGKAVHLVATADIPSLNIYGIGIANNGGGTDGLEIPLNYGTLLVGSRSNVSSGDNILLIRSATAMQAYFEGCYDNFDVVIEFGGGLSFNGDDAFTLYMNGTLNSTSGLVETFGDPNVDGSGEAWDLSLIHI